MRLQNQVAIVTGSTRGIGQAIAEHLLREGAAVVINSRTEKDVATTTQELLVGGGRVLGVTADITDLAQVENLVRRTIEEFQRVDILVNNAAIVYPVDFVNSSPAEWRELFEANFYGYLYCTHAVVRWMVDNHCAGRIINISSVLGFQVGKNYQSPYNVAKAATDHLTRSMAVELAPYHILVNGVAPGFVSDTGMIKAGPQDDEAEWMRQVYLNPLRVRLPLQRSGLSKEIAPVVALLADPECTYLTGQIIVVDGGVAVTL
jgi:3-oxoacyl-[acyl-carrier protein] reductase